MRYPRDRFGYERDSRSCPLQVGSASGVYVYVQDLDGVIHVVPDTEGHLHPKVLGGGQPARYAGDLTIEENTVMDVTNLSGTFQFRGKGGLLAVAEQLRALGFQISPRAIRWFNPDNGEQDILD